MLGDGRLPDFFVDVDGYLGSVLWSWNFLPCNRFIVNIVEGTKITSMKQRRLDWGWISLVR